MAAKVLCNSLDKDRSPFERVAKLGKVDRVLLCGSRNRCLREIPPAIKKSIETLLNEVSIEKSRDVKRLRVKRSAVPLVFQRFVGHLLGSPASCNHVLHFKTGRSQVVKMHEKSEIRKNHSFAPGGHVLNLPDCHLECHHGKIRSTTLLFVCCDTMQSSISAWQFA